jgi:predicted ATP-dependent endonuclease of OLD family
MYISKINLHNFKGFSGDHELSFDNGVNFFVGDNNCGKSSVFEAIDFLRAKRDRNEVITKNELESDGFVSVEVEFRGDDIDSLVETEALKKYKAYVIDTNSQKSLRIMRSSEEKEVMQASKLRKLDIKYSRF